MGFFFMKSCWHLIASSSSAVWKFEWRDVWMGCGARWFLFFCIKVSSSMCYILFCHLCYYLQLLNVCAHINVFFKCVNLLSIFIWRLCISICILVLWNNGVIPCHRLSLFKIRSYTANKKSCQLCIRKWYFLQIHRFCLTGETYHRCSLSEVVRGKRKNSFVVRKSDNTMQLASYETRGKFKNPCIYFLEESFYHPFYGSFICILIQHQPLNSSFFLHSKYAKHKVNNYIHML